MGHDINTIELIWIVSIAMVAIFVFLVVFALIKQPIIDEPFKAFPNKKDKRIFKLLILLTLWAFCSLVLVYLNTNIMNDQIPVYLLFLFAGIPFVFTIFSAYFPKIKSTFRQLVLIFICYLVFWIAATEMDWHAVEAGFHWKVLGDPRKPPGDFWIWADYRMAMWLIYLPIIILLISIMFKLIGNSKQATLKLSITNYLILFMGIDSILIFFISGLAFPPNWTWSNIHYSIFNGTFSLPLLIGFALAIGVLIFFVHKKIKVSSDEAIE